MTRYVSVAVDDLRHRLACSWLTECGRYPTPQPPGSDWPACHICLPADAHPLEPVWAWCRRLDDRFNAGAGEPR